MLDFFKLTKNKFSSVTLTFSKKKQKSNVILKIQLNKIFLIRNKYIETTVSYLCP